ncbi:hypothetical protein BH11PSE8_BH11PSE8_30680 [soil metagenome]
MIITFTRPASSEQIEVQVTSMPSPVGPEGDSLIRARRMSTGAERFYEGAVRWEGWLCQLALDVRRGVL